MKSEVTKNPQTTDHWTKQYFSEEYYRSLPLAFKSLAAAGQAKLIEVKLNLPPNAHILDVPCGFGRLLVPLAKKGYEITGVDSNASYLQYADEALTRSGVQAALHCQDMHNLSLPTQFDGAICIGSSIGYFSEAEDRRFFEQVYQHLKPSARFLIEIDGYEWLMASAPQRNWFAGENGWVCLTEFVKRDLVAGRVYIEHRFLNLADHTEQHAYVDCRVYTPRELIKLLIQVGFHVIEVTTAEGEAYTTSIPKAIITVEKSA